MRLKKQISWRSIAVTLLAALLGAALGYWITSQTAPLGLLGVLGGAALLVLALLLLTVSIFLDPRAYLRLLPSNWELLRAASLMVMSGFLLYWAVHSLVFWVRSRGGPPPVSCRGPGSGGSSGA